MRAALFQTDTIWLSPDENRRRIEDMIDRSPQADLIVLPEMFTTGFCMSPEKVAEKGGLETLAWMQRLAASKHAALTGSIAVAENGRYYNRLYFVKPDGDAVHYDKRHLFSYAGEDKIYTAGDKRVVVEYGGFRILLQVCYDLRFPVFSRNAGDYDAIIYAANWPVSRIGAWNTLVRSRAVENLCYVAAVNRVGDDPVCKYGGSSAVIDFKGNVLAEAGGDAAEVIVAEWNKDALLRFRKKFSALQDADHFIPAGWNDK
ncbi:MAG: amidohydrolase [Prevotella sp.]|jgi:predicted amidohydrolase|nr:amidohydrolase [Prevotella sp.]